MFYRPNKKLAQKLIPLKSVIFIKRAKAKLYIGVDILLELSTKMLVFLFMKILNLNLVHLCIMAF